MAPFRVAVAHTSDDHENSAPFQWRRTLDSVDEAENALSAAAEEYPESDGYDLRVEELIEVSPPGDDGTGGEHEWRSVGSSDAVNAEEVGE